MTPMTLAELKRHIATHGAIGRPLGSDLLGRLQRAVEALRVLPTEAQAPGLLDELDWIGAVNAATTQLEAGALGRGLCLELLERLDRAMKALGEVPSGTTPAVGIPELLDSLRSGR